MTIYLKGIEETPEKFRAEVRYYSLDGLDAQYVGTLTAIDEIPQKPEKEMGKNNVLYFNPVDSSVWWEQEDRPLTEMEEMQKKISEQQQLIDAMLGVVE